LTSINALTKRLINPKALGLVSGLNRLHEGGHFKRKRGKTIAIHTQGSENHNPKRGVEGKNCGFFERSWEWSRLGPAGERRRRLGRRQETYKFSVWGPESVQGGALFHKWGSLERT